MKRLRRILRGFLRMLRKAAIFPVLFLAYLLQVCLLPRFPAGGVTPSLVMAVIAVCTVCFGKLRAFWAGAVIGILMEAMQPTIPLVSLVLYPASAVFCAFFFADKTAQKLEYERSLGKPGRNASPYWRTLACAAMNTAVYETVNLVYIALGGTALNLRHFGRAFLNIGLTTLIALPLMMVLRPLFGKSYLRLRRKKSG